MSDLSTQISTWNPILQEQQTQLETEYNAMEATLASLKSTQNALAQYFNQSSTSSNGSKLAADQEDQETSHARPPVPAARTSPTPSPVPPGNGS